MMLALENIGWLESTGHLSQANPFAQCKTSSFSLSTVLIDICSWFALNIYASYIVDLIWIDSQHFAKLLIPIVKSGGMRQNKPPRPRRGFPCGACRHPCDICQGHDPDAWPGAVPSWCGCSGFRWSLPLFLVVVAWPIWMAGWLRAGGLCVVVMVLVCAGYSRGSSNFRSRKCRKHPEGGLYGRMQTELP